MLNCGAYGSAACLSPSLLATSASRSYRLYDAECTGKFAAGIRMNHLLSPNVDDLQLQLATSQEFRRRYTRPRTIAAWSSLRKRLCRAESKTDYRICTGRC
ncbi:hypothetical protein F444_01572 [Phytophthora nicotianae P1976]|uniref:Uncharacterized protein n=1 Tax=Phytophthora nicotianae P1976 TaxID=1317066 RepID=A0A081B080_PHYNI|nr:hypothetical protein F444_01572 [Phytophthora nicotianae P1976]